MVNRRNFMVGGIGVAAIGGQALAGSAAPPLNNFAAPPLQQVRVAFIGTGRRGTALLELVATLEGIEIVGVANRRPYANEAATAVLSSTRHRPKFFLGSSAYEHMLVDVRADVAIIATPWDLHADMAIKAMKAGLHAFVEIPLATTVDDCWRVVEAAERYQKHCLMLENVCYGREEMALRRMVKDGLFGEILHTEAGYLHDLRFQMHDVSVGTGTWRTYQYAQRNGNLYPTHGLGPVCGYLDINRGDRLSHLVSMSSPSLSRNLYAEEQLPSENPYRELKFICGDINTSIIKTAKGKTILLQWDEQLPRPYSRLNRLQGTRGAWAGFPNQLALEGSGLSAEQWMSAEKTEEYLETYASDLWKEGPAGGSHGGMDIKMLWHNVECLRKGLPLGISVYDAATWSVVGPLSELSVANGGTPVEIPDFTRGGWQLG